MTAVAIRPLTPDRLQDYLRFFATRAFSDNAEWSGCYCYFPYCNGRFRDWPQRTEEQNRAAISQLIENGTAHGYLAYLGDEVIGWCNAGPFANFPILRKLPRPDANAGAIVCFVVCPTQRGRGIAKELLSAACSGLKDRGMTAVYAQPSRDAGKHSENYTGPLAMYLAANFEVIGEAEHGHVIVRRELTAF
jgi:GNAT superfamily N-acetyltransferase